MCRPKDDTVHRLDVCYICLHRGGWRGHVGRHGVWDLQADRTQPLSFRSPVGWEVWQLQSCWSGVAWYDSTQSKYDVATVAWSVRYGEPMDGQPSCRNIFQVCCFAELARMHYLRVAQRSERTLRSAPGRTPRRKKLMGLLASRLDRRKYATRDCLVASSWTSLPHSAWASP